MDYKVLYRKYRPKNFEEVVGQKNVVKLLKDSIINEKISHAYIYSGPRGTGKTSLAKIFAKAIICSSNKNGNPCDECDQCKNFAYNSDIYEIDAASNNGVDQIREIIDNIKLAPISSKYKVYIIDEVHMLSTSAFNALLLTLEEPPSHAIFILATTNIENVPITVLSRCQRMDFRKISNEDIIERLKFVCKCENIDITDEAIKEIAFCADGGLRDALSILDQLSKENTLIDEEMVLKTIGIISSKKVNELVLEIDKGNCDFIINFISEIKELSIDYKTFVKKLIEEIKIYCIRIKQNELYSNIGYHRLKELCIELANSLYKANINVDSFSILELILLDYMENGNINKEGFVVKEKTNEINEQNDDNVKLEKIETNVIKGEFLNIKTNLVHIRINNTFVGANKALLNKVNGIWDEYISTLKSKKVKGLLLDAKPALVSKDIIVIKTEFKENADLINENLTVIEDNYNKKYGEKCKFIAVDYANWEDEMNLYKSNIKSGIKYEYMDEDVNLDEKESDLNDIFCENKIEIE